MYRTEIQQFDISNLIDVVRMEPSLEIAILSKDISDNYLKDCPIFVKRIKASQLENCKLNFERQALRFMIFEVKVESSFLNLKHVTCRPIEEIGQENISFIIKIA